MGVEICDKCGSVEPTSEAVVLCPRCYEELCLAAKRCPNCGGEAVEDGRYADPDEGGEWEGFGDWKCLKCGYEKVNE